MNTVVRWCLGHRSVVLLTTLLVLATALLAVVAREGVEGASLSRVARRLVRPWG